MKSVITLAAFALATACASAPASQERASQQLASNEGAVAGLHRADATMTDLVGSDAIGDKTSASLHDRADAKSRARRTPAH